MESATRMLHVKPVVAENQPFTQQIYQTSVFRMPSYDQAVKLEHEVKPSSYYTRWGNPTTNHLEDQLCCLSGYEKALIFPSGMSAITMTILALVKPGDTILASTRLYGDTLRFLLEELPKFRITVIFFDVTSVNSLAEFSTINYQLVFFETLSNPGLILADINGICKHAHEKKAIVLCDATFTPIGVLLKPTVASDVVLQSLTKYIGGHSTASGGAVLTSNKLLYDQIWRKQSLYGACIDPNASWLLSEGLQTLEIRLEKQSASALKIANFLYHHPLVDSVYYPMLEVFSQYKLAKDLLNMGGGVISFSLKVGMPLIARFLENTKIIILAVSLGDIRSSIEHALSMSHSMLGSINTSAVGRLIDQLEPEDNLIRLSIGIENVDDLIEDLEQALCAVSKGA